MLLIIWDARRTVLFPDSVYIALVPLTTSCGTFVVRFTGAWVSSSADLLSTGDSLGTVGILDGDDEGEPNLAHSPSTLPSGVHDLL